MRRRVIWAAALLALSGFCLSGANTLSELRGLKTRESRMPVYSNDRLQLLLYCAECEQKGRLLETKEPVLDIIRRDADIDMIDTGPKTRNIYPLGAPFADVFRFWSGHLFSDGVVVTDKADIDQENQQAAGSDEVFFRSPLLDLDGIGFDGDYRKRTIFIRKNVRIVLRTGASDPLKYLKSGKAPEKYEFLRGSADTLLIDMTKRVITLAGRVRVSEERGVIDCARMQIFLPGEKDRDRDLSPDEEWGIKGVSRIICDGRVRVVRMGVREMQQATAERMDYDLAKGLLRLTGTISAPPTLRQGRNFLRGQVIDVYREQERMVVERDCELFYARAGDGQKDRPVRATADRMEFDNRSNAGTLTGNVRVSEPRFRLDCARLDLALVENGPADKRQQAAVSEVTGMPEFAPGGKKELRNIHCSGGVRLTRIQPPGREPEHAVAQEADMTWPQEIVTLTGGRPTITHGRDKLSGDRMVIDLKRERLVAEPNCQVEFTGSRKTASEKPADRAAARIARTIVLADRGDFGYLDNLLNFTGNVRVLDPRMSLVCGRMDIFLKDAPGADPNARTKWNADAAAEDLAASNSAKVLDRIVCTEEVQASEPRMSMDCDKLTLLFRQAAGAAAPGMFQSHGTELFRVLSEGNVVLENVPEDPPEDGEKQADRKPSGLDRIFPGGNAGSPMRLTADRGEADLPGNVTEFHGDVKVRHAQGSLDCDDLYLYAKNVGTAPTDAAARLAALDDDPFAATEPTQVPQVISIGDGRELDRAVAMNNVVLVRRSPTGGSQRVTGKKAEYFVPRRLVELTGEPPEYARIVDSNPQNNGRGEKITVFLDRESVEFDGQVQLELDQKNLPKDDGRQL